MRKLICMCVMSIMLFSSQMAYAADVWIGNDGGTELYVISDTIYSENENAVKVSVKSVKNGKLVNIDLWSFGKFRSEWRYTTDKMRQRGTTGRVEWDSITGKILSYCLEHLK